MVIVPSLPWYFSAAPVKVRIGKVKVQLEPSSAVRVTSMSAPG